MSVLENVYDRVPCVDFRNITFNSLNEYDFLELIINVFSVAVMIISSFVFNNVNESILFCLFKTACFKFFMTHLLSILFSCVVKKGLFGLSSMKVEECVK